MKELPILPQCEELLLSRDAGVLRVTLNRPHKRNAMNAALVQELMAVFTAIEVCRDIRAVVLRGAEANFCAGGDISGMRERTDGASPEQAARIFNRSFGHMLTQVNAAPQVVITLLEGAVLGGGFGLACVSDVAIADRNAIFAMPETGLGIIPAQIAPFVVSRIGLTHTRRLALLGDRVDGAGAFDLGITHYLTEGPDAMQERLDQVLSQVRRCAPGANALTKGLMLQVGSLEHEQLLDEAAELFSASLHSDEGREGTRAFAQKRKPGWAS